ncbi:transcription factor bHLH101-like [Lotus japonicus]|uniref:transcription factor bHLH101-like n=1 Tax=Lotus japonicus TaxID=34305 RepID=UPI002586DC83|nr:transcription factor bHLH101-like [Lotus japonicus]
MLRFPSPVFSYSNMECLLDDEPFNHNQNNFNKERVSSSEYSFPNQPQPAVVLQAKVVEMLTAPSPDTKKLNHNASERDRRKKINSLIASLRSLLPAGQDQMKKMSIPATISGVIKYLPELQQQVKGLTKKKEKLLSRISQQGDAVNEESRKRKKFINPHHNSADFIVSNSWLNDCEAAIHIISSNYEEAHNHKTPLPEIILCLENNGYFLLNASSTETFGGSLLHLAFSSGKNS